MIRSTLAAGSVRRELAERRQAIVRVRGRSMTPLLADGAQVELRPPRPGEKLIGAIVAVDTGGQLVLHRVVGEGGGEVQTRGIARGIADPPWRRDAVLGVVCAIASDKWRLAGNRRLRWLAATAAALQHGRRAVSRALRMGRRHG